MNQLRRFMYGRYGFDQLSRALVVISLIISVIASFSHNSIIILISYIPFFIAILRILSKNIAKRTQENMLYCKITGILRNELLKVKLTLVGTRTHKYYKCAHCRQTIRIPRGKGKICITCPKCRTEFVRRT